MPTFEKCVSCLKEWDIDIDRSEVTMCPHCNALYCNFCWTEYVEEGAGCFTCGGVLEEVNDD